MRRIFRIIIPAIAGLVILIGLGMGWMWFREDRGPSFRTVEVKRGDIVATISATGTVEPEEVVDVGAQVGGMIRSFGKDARGKTVDYGSIVTSGMVMARIDDSLYTANLNSAKAQLQQAEANEMNARANVLQMKAKLVQARQDWDRARKLGPSDALSQSSYDQYQTTFEVAKANLTSAEAAVEQSRAAVAQARASLNTAQINLNYCTIKTPVNGIIIDRRVNIGQTVVASLSAPSLFLIAKDLKRIQVWVSVNEADIGVISEGQTVTFTVDAIPNRIFKGRVGKIRLNATMSQNVVTYTVEVNTSNEDNKLLPYLTANAKFKIGQKEGVLLVPNAALRWTPRPNLIDPEAQKRSQAGATRRQGRGSRPLEEQKERGVLWVVRGKYVRPLRVTVGLSDGQMTEVEGRELTEGLKVIIGEQNLETAGGPPAGVSPFTPQIGRGFRQGQPQGPGGPEEKRPNP
ncbi:MAG TPA: efflux RND transporter periplasmic adaptor subunit [Thermodesulfobacteriota bacterium]|nr:efflux RND transporter periplasmic adaptor subunit [Thermodesulfobacteriota bacterium]